MNGTLRDAQAPSYRECLLPSMARTPSVTQVTPAKKITFLKRGDPRFSGVRLAVHQRTFKSFSTLMDELSQRVPLSFGVRSVTTPRGLHGLSTLEQLEDGGCYLCSDRKPPKTSSGPGWPPGRSPSDQQSQVVEGQWEAPRTSSSWKNSREPRRITLVKNGDPQFQQTVVLSHRDTRSLSAFLGRASGLLRFPVKQVYTPSGEKVASLKALPCGLSVLVCAGHEPFRPLAMEGARRSGTETLSGQTPRNKNGSWGPKAKQSEIHPLSGSGSRRPSLLSERAGLGDPLVALHRAWVGPAPDRHPQDSPAQLGPLVAGDDVEKKVHLNEDGSLSVEMKVRFHLLGSDPLLWPRRAGRARGEGPVLGEADPLPCGWEGHPGESSEPGAQSLGFSEAGCMETFEQGQWKPGPGYEIWTNPRYTARREGAASGRRSRLTQRPPSRGPWSQGVAGRKRSSKDSVSPASSDRAPEGSEPHSSCCSRSPEGSAGSCALHPASRAGPQRGPGRDAGSTPRAAEGLGPEEAGPGSRGHCCLEPRPRGVAGALSAPSASAGCQEESSERGGRHQGRPSKARAVTSPQKATHGRGPCSSSVNPSLRNEDPQAEGAEQGTGHPQARAGYGKRLPLASGPLVSGGPAGGCSPSPTCASAPGRRGQQEGRASAGCSPSVPGHGRGAQRGRPRRHHSPGDTQRPLDSPVSRQMLGPPSPGGACPAIPAPLFSGSSSSARNWASQDPGPPSPTSPNSQDLRGVSSAPATPVSRSDCPSNFYPPFSPSAETEFRSQSLSSTSDSFSSPANGLREKAGGVPKSPQPLYLPVGQHEGGKPGAHRGGCHSPMGTPGVCRSPGSETQASQPQDSQGPLSEACLVGLGYCPAPPRARPPVRKHPSCSSHGDQGADRGPRGAEPGEEPLDLQRPQPPGSESGGPGTAARAASGGSPSPGARAGRMFQGQLAGGGEGLEEQEDSGQVTPGALPRTSPEAVVREWLSRVPEDPVPMSCEMVDGGGDAAGAGLGGPTEGPVDKHAPEDPEEPAQARRPSLEGAPREQAEAEGALRGMGDAGAQPGAGLPQGRAAEGPQEAGVGRGQCVLPRRVSASVQIMKALMGSKQGRPTSLPEVSGPAGRRLSHSAQALVTCLTRLHFFDEDLGSPARKVRFTDSPRYQELLSTFQALWPGCGLGWGELDSGPRGCGRCQALPGLGSHAVTEDFTPTSSSGVDVGSGSGGSGEGSGPCAVDCALVSERVELPLEIPCQTSDASASENPEEPGSQESSDSTASSRSQAGAGAARRDEAGGSSGEQTLGGDLDQVVENTIQEEGVHLEKIQEEKEGAEPRGQGVSGFREEERATGQGLSEARSLDGAGAGEDEGVQEEEAGGEPASDTLRPAGRREHWAETPGCRTERDPHASGSQSGPSAEPALEKLPSAMGTDHEHTQAECTRGAAGKGTSVAHRVSPDPDPRWVSRLLRKMEEAFLAHLAGATAELRARWGLQSSDLLDQMVAELQQDVSRRLRGSTEKEIRKVESRAGRKVLGPPRGALRWEPSLQTEQRRGRLRGLRNLSAFSEQTRAPGPPSLSLEDVPNLRGALGPQLGGEADREGFCPCEACMRKNMCPVSPKDTVGTASAPIEEAFDLQQILQKRKAGCANGETAGTASEKTGMEPLQRDPSGTGTGQGAAGGLGLGLDPGPGIEEGDEDEGSQTLGRGEDPGGGEEDADPCGGHHPATVEGEEQGVRDKEENTAEGSRAELCVQSEALGGADRSPGGQNDTREAQETEGEGQPEAGRGNLGEKERSPQASPRQGQSGEASGHSSPDQEGRPIPAPTPGGDTRGQRSGRKTGLFSSRTSSLGNCSQLSQKGSTEGPSNGDTGTFGDEPEGVPGSEGNATGMHAESSTSEREGPSLGSGASE